MAQFARPSTDTETNGWVTQAGSASNLFDAINEATADDADYARISSPQGEILKVDISLVGDPQSATGHVVRYRIGKSGSATVNMTVALMQGGTEIAAWEHANVGTTLTTYEQTLTSGQANAITDYGDLALWISADGAAPPESFTEPDAVTGLLVWFKPETLGAAASAVSSWTDSSGNANPAVQATSGKQPVVEANVLNGHAGVVFDGTDDILSTGNLALSGTDDCMVYIVYADRSAGTARSMVLELGPNHEANTNAFGLSHEIGNWPMFSNRGTSTAQTRKVGRSQIASPATPKIFAGRIDRQMKYGTATPFVNGKNESFAVTQSSITTGNNFGALPLNIGAREGSGTQSLWANIVVLEVAVYNTRHTTQVKRGIEAYFAQKYGITLLPAYGVIAFDGDSWWDAQGTELVVQSDAILRRLDQSAGVWDVVDFSVSGHTWANSNADVTTQVDPYVWTGKQCIVASDLGENDAANVNRTYAQIKTDNDAWHDARHTAGWTKTMQTTWWMQNEAVWVASRRKQFFDSDRPTWQTYMETGFVGTHGDAFIDYSTDPILASDVTFNDFRAMIGDNTHWNKAAMYRIADATEVALASLGVAFRTIGPATYATPVSWFKADAGLSLADTNPVSSWANQGSSGVAATASLTERPTYRTNQQNGLPGLLFDGSANKMTIATIDLSGTKQATCIAVFKSTGTGQHKIHEATASATAATTGFYIERSNQLNMQTSSFGNVGESRNTSANPYAITLQPGVLAGVFDRRLSTNQSFGYANMNPDGTHNPNLVNTNNFGNDTHYLGMRHTGLTNKFAGTLFEDLVYDVALERAEIYDIVHALDQKWDLAPAPFLGDYLAGADTTNLTAHTPQYGTSWTKHGSYAANILFTDADRIRNDGGTGTTALYYASVAPPHADTYIAADVVQLSDNNDSFVGVAWRINTAADTFYRVVYDNLDGSWRFWKRVAGVDTELGTKFAATLTVGTEYTVTAHSRQGSHYVWIDGTARFTNVSDSAIAGPGSVGVFLSGAATNSTGLHLSHVIAYPFWYGP